MEERPQEQIEQKPEQEETPEVEGHRLEVEDREDSDDRPEVEGHFSDARLKTAIRPL